MRSLPCSSTPMPPLPEVSSLRAQLRGIKDAMVRCRLSTLTECRLPTGEYMSTTEARRQLKGHTLLVPQLAELRAEQVTDLNFPAAADRTAALAGFGVKSGGPKKGALLKTLRALKRLQPHHCQKQVSTASH